MKKQLSGALSAALMLTGICVLPQAQAISLTTVNDSALGYGGAVTGAVSDKLFYTLGGGSAISTPATRSNMKKLGLSASWSSDLQCGNFDLNTTIGNQLNGVTAGYKNLMSDVISGATGAVASLPALLIQRANPGLYDMLTNGVLQANVAFDKAQLNCQNMSKRLANMVDSGSWSQQAQMEEYKELVNSGDGDAIRINNAGNKLTGTSGHNWIGGEMRGGKGQDAIKPTHDLITAGYNMMNGLDVTSTSSVGSSECNGGACEKFSSAKAAADEAVTVLGDQALRTCNDSTQCTSGDSADQPGTSQAGTGFSPLFEASVKANTEQLVKLVNGSVKPTATELAKLKTGGLPVTASIIRSLQRDPDSTALTARLANDLAMSDTVQTALLMRRMLVTGMSEPNVASQPKAVAAGENRIDSLDREINALKTEMELKRELAKNSVLTILERDNERVSTNPNTAVSDDTDARFSEMSQSSSSDSE